MNAHPKLSEAPEWLCPDLAARVQALAISADRDIPWHPRPSPPLPPSRVPGWLWRIVFFLGDLIGHRRLLGLLP